MAERAIVDGLNLYAVALDSHAWDLWDLVFTGDADLDYPGAMHWSDLESFKREFGAYHETLRAHQHVISNHQAVVRGDEAHALSYSNYRLYEHGQNDAENMREGMAWYDDRLVLTPAGWRIAARRARVFWHRGTPPRGADAQGNAQAYGAMMQTAFVDDFAAEAHAGQIGYINALRPPTLKPLKDAKQ